MRIYTGAGDRGMTSLFSGERVLKNDRRVCACGEMDELSAVLGLLESDLPNSEADLRNEIHTIQSNLFQAGAWIAVYPVAENTIVPKSFQTSHSTWLESHIDRMDAALPALASFILPGGCRAAALAHVARTVCRRVERRLVGVLEETTTEPYETEIRKVLVFLNRLSDYLFVLARYCNHRERVPEHLWQS